MGVGAARLFLKSFFKALLCSQRFSGYCTGTGLPIPMGRPRAGASKKKTGLPSSSPITWLCLAMKCGAKPGALKMPCW